MVKQLVNTAIAQEFVVMVVRTVALQHGTTDTEFSSMTEENMQTLTAIMVLIEHIDEVPLR